MCTSIWPGTADFRASARAAARAGEDRALASALYRATQPAREEPDFDPMALDFGQQ